VISVTKSQKNSRQVERAGCVEKARMDREFCARIERAFKTGDENRQAAGNNA